MVPCLAEVDQHSALMTPPEVEADLQSSESLVDNGES